MIGQKFNRYTVVADAQRKDGKRQLLCECECGTQKVVDAYALRIGEIKSCGCYKGDKIAAFNLTHGRTVGGVIDATYNAWRAMLNRCNGVAKANRKDYFDRGIRVCERWQTFENFLADMGEHPVGMQIDRIDNDGNYEPGNCRWVTAKENARNRRNTRYLTYDGKTMDAASWADELGIPRTMVHQRLNRGWPIDRVLGQKPRRSPQP